MRNIRYVLGLLGAALLLGALLFNAMINPVDNRRKVPASELATLDAEWELDRGPEVSPSGNIEKGFTKKPELWRRLVKRVRLILTPPNMTSILKGVRPTRLSMSMGTDIKVRIITPSYPRGKYFGVEDRVEGTRIKEITKMGVVFAIRSSGKEYTKELIRK